MTLKVGQVWLTRGGHIALIVLVEDGYHSTYPVCAQVRWHEWYTREGKYHSNGLISPYDLVRRLSPPEGDPG